METSLLLCDSLHCRLCGEENGNSTSLFEPTENKLELIHIVNKYLPLKVEKDGKYPCLICPGCNIQLQATKIFFDLVIEGQIKLHNLFTIQQETLRRQEKQKQQLENVLKNVNPNTKVETYEIQTDETGEKFLIQIISDGPLFPPEHELSLKVDGLEKPKRRRGRPPKPSVEEQAKSIEIVNTPKPSEEAPEEEADFDVDGRRKRKIKAPIRFSEVLQGKELDRMFKEEGVIEDDSLSDEDLNSAENRFAQDEIIGHMQDKNGEDTGQLIIVNKSTNKFRDKSKGSPSIGTKKKHKFECEICGKVFLHLGRLEVHRSFHKNIKYKCNKENCTLEADTKIMIEEHHKLTGHSGVTLVETLDNYGQIQLEHVSSDSNEQEPMDNEDTSNFPSIINDNAEIDGEQFDLQALSPKHKEKKDKFQCKACCKQFSCKQNYEVHCKAVHENQRPYHCQKCDKSFPYLKSLKCHMLQHTDKFYPCEICDKVFSHPSSLVYHREAEHNNGRKFVCNKCKKSFKHKQLLLRHQLVHSDERPHMCRFCDASFKTRANLLNHMPTHTGEKKHFCNQCGQTFAHKTSLTLHVRWHNGQKPYECDVCLKSFSQKGNLAEHRRIHTGEKPYCCDICGRKFTTSSQFKLHVKRHTGERPWRCEYCSKTFLHKDTWKCHTRRHRNERPYQCTQCFRGFTEQWALRKHERLHTGERPYQCEICSKSFADSSNLTKHKKIHIHSKLIKGFKLDEMDNPDAVKVVTTQSTDNHILYLTLQESNSNDQPQTLLHIMDDLDQNSAQESNQSQPDNNVLENAFLNELPEQDESAEISLGELQIQQLIDQDGNPLSIPTSSGNIKLVSANDGDTSNFHGLLPDGTLIPFNLNISAQDGKQTLQIDSFLNNVLKSSKDEEKSAAKEQILEESEIEQFLEDTPNSFLEDGQNVCFVTTYNVDDSINQQYLT